MNYLRRLLTRANPFTHAKTRKFYLEIAAAIGAVIIVGLVVNALSPYRALPVVSFYESSETHFAYHRATVQSVNAVDKRMTVIIRDGPDSDRTAKLPMPSYTKVTAGNTIVVANSSSSADYAFIDHYRLPGMMIMLAIFIMAVLLIGRKRGASSMAGLVFSIGIIGVMIVPLILAGHDALWVCIGGAFLIAVASILIAHGFRRRTYISLACILFMLVFVAIAAELAVTLLQLTGLADEYAGFLTTDEHSAAINLSGLLVGGIVIATLGVLDDIVTAQVATVDELITANRTLPLCTIYKKAMSVGGEHIASLVNTLALVYAGTALPLILLISSNTNDLFVFFNSEFVVTEVARTIIASLALVAAVPMSTLAASMWFHARATSNATTGDMV